jgi:hypothetical protein
MNAGYIVVEGKENADLLRLALPAALIQDIKIVGTSDWYEAFSLAGTLMSERSRPVILVLETTSDSPIHIQERQQTLEGLILPAASTAPFQVLIASPALSQLEKLHFSIQKHPVTQEIIQFLSNCFTQAA